MTFTDAVWQPDSSIVDTHCHYNLEPLWPEWRAHWERAQAHGVQVAWVPGTTLETSRRAIEIAQADENLFAWIGVHPGDGGVQGEPVETLQAFAQLLQEDQARTRPVILGLGEIGLDYFRLSANDHVSRAQQLTWFRAQLELAQRYTLPVVLHVRDAATPEEPTSGNAYWDTVVMLEELEWQLPFSLHCVSGPKAYVERLLQRGAYCGFDGNSTYPKAENIRELFALTPPDRRLLETDAPYLPPQPWRGQICEPWMIAETASWLREHLG